MIQASIGHMLKLMSKRDDTYFTFIYKMKWFQTKSNDKSATLRSIISFEIHLRLKISYKFNQTKD